MSEKQEHVASGKMLWFNAAKDVGALRTSHGERIEVTGAAFSPGEKPAERCAGKAIQFAAADGGVSKIAFVRPADQRRARRRHRG